MYIYKDRMDQVLTEQQIRDREKWKRYHATHRDTRLAQMKAYDEAHHERRMETQRARRAAAREG